MTSRSLTSRRPHRTGFPPRRGAASLVVVMVLFFIITLVAAYTSRNLLFEQRTSANHYRSTVAFEAADAGVEWALARLNDARMNANCTPLATAGAVGSPPEPSFRQQYLTIDPATGVVTPVPDLVAGCTFDGVNWSCHCPTTAINPAPTPALTGTGPHAAFWVRFLAVAGGRPGVVRIQVNACTRAAVDCLRFDREPQPGDGLSTVWAMVSLRSAMASPPTAALSVRGGFGAIAVGTKLTLTNADLASGGFTIHSGPALAFTPVPASALTGVTLNTIPGTPGALSMAHTDASLALPDLTPALTPATPANTGTNRMFNSVFGMWPTTYAGQPGLVTVDCTATCTAAAINDAILLNPGHVVHAVGTGGTLSVDADIGTALAPVLIVADGNVQFGATPRTVFGAIYSRAATWTTAGSGTVQGSAVAENGFQAVGTQAINFDRDVLFRVRNLTGTFAKIPGGWRDFQP